MGFKKIEFLCCISLLTTLAPTSVLMDERAALAQNEAKQQTPSLAEFVTAEELKAKLARNEPLTIIDVRSASGLSGENKIKGAYYVKLRRLKYRLGFSPLKEAPRDREVVTYCACPNDEASVKAAQVLRESGFKRVRVLKGGWVTWKKANGQVEPMARG